MRKQLITLILLLAFIGGHPFDLRAQTSVPVINAVGGNDAISNGNSGASTLGASPAKPKGKKSHGFKKAKVKKYSRYRKSSKKGKGASGDNGSDGSQTEVSGQRDVSNQADSSKR
jgi:hypothetical protein